MFNYINLLKVYEYPLLKAQKRPSDLEGYQGHFL